MCLYAFALSSVISDHRRKREFYDQYARELLVDGFDELRLHNRQLRCQWNRQWRDQFLGGREFWRRASWIDRHFKRRCGSHVPGSTTVGLSVLAESNHA